MNKILILGSNGFLGKNLKKNFPDALTSDDRSLLDLRNCTDVLRAFQQWQPEIVIHCAGVVGSSESNRSVPAFDVFHDNVTIDTNVLFACAHTSSVRKVILFSTFRLQNQNQKQQQQTSAYLSSKAVLRQQMAFFQQQCPSIQVVCLVLPNLFGEFDAYLENGRIVMALLYKLRHGITTVHAHPEDTVSLLPVEDVVRLVQQICHGDGIDQGEIHVHHPQGTWTLQKLADFLAQELHSDLQFTFTRIEPRSSDNTPHLFRLKNFVFSDLKAALRLLINETRQGEYHTIC